MSSTLLAPAAIRNIVGEIFVAGMPFNQTLGMELLHLDTQQAQVSLLLKPFLIGNSAQQILHGGVIAALLDVATGVLCVSHKLSQQPITEQQLYERLACMGTVDLKVDYLRPGHGQKFIATATLLRAGNKIAVVRAELHNQDQVHIASATATYLVG